MIKVAKGKGKSKIPNMHIVMPYTYLMAWLVMHSPSLMSTSNYLGLEKSYFVEKYERSTWIIYYMPVIHKTLQHHQNYEINMCFLDLPGSGYEFRFKDILEPDNFSVLSLGFFLWLINIRPSHLVNRQDNICYTESYTSSRFAHQFGYNQLYVRSLTRPSLCVFK